MAQRKSLRYWRKLKNALQSVWKYIKRLLMRNKEVPPSPVDNQESRPFEISDPATRLESHLSANSKPRATLTIPEQILQGARQLNAAGRTRFTRVDIRDTLHIKAEIFNASYNPIIQAMRVDQPGGAPAIAKKYRGVFRQVERSLYELTEYGLKLIGSGPE